jgi:hypothetical protein
MAMSRSQAPRSAIKDFSFTRELKEIGLFFERRDQVHKTMRRLVKRLEKAKIAYAVVGAMALAAHRYRRATTDVDVLLTPEGFADFQKRFVPKNYDRIKERRKRFVDRVNGITVDILVTGLFPGSGKPGPIAYPDPSQVSEVFEDQRVVDLPTLVQLKLAARRHKDFGDVVELVRSNDLDESFAERLHPSVRRDYIECLEEKRREDEYIAREG